MIDYKEYATEDLSGVLHASINTRMNNHIRISSIYRKFENINFESWGWETFAWNDDQIIRQYDVLYNSEDVVNLHAEIESTWYATGEIINENN